MSDQEEVDDVTDPTGVQSPGGRLRRARESCGLSREEVASHLNLSIEKIDSLERGEVSSIAAPVFVTGYLRAYAKLVNLPADDVITDFDALSNMDSPSMDPASSPAANDYGQMSSVSSSPVFQNNENDWGKWGVLASIGVVLIVVAYVFLFSNEEKSSARKNGAKNIEKVSQSENKQPLAQPMPEVLVSKVVDEERQAEEVEIVPPVKAGLGESDRSELSLYLSEDSWIEVSDAQEQRLLYRLGKAGTSQTVSGIAPFKVRLGYVNGVSVMYNGESYDLSRFANRKSVRFLVGRAGDRMLVDQ